MSSFDVISWPVCGEPDTVLPAVSTCGLESTCIVIVSYVTGPREPTQTLSLLSCTKWYLTLFFYFKANSLPPANIILSGEWPSPNKMLTKGYTKNTGNHPNKSSSFQLIVFALYKCNHNFIRDLYSTGHGTNVPTVGVHLSFLINWLIEIMLKYLFKIRELLQHSAI